MVGVLHRIEDGGTLLAALRTSGRERSLAARQELTAPGDDTALVGCFAGALKVERHLRDGRRFVSEFLYPDETVILRDRWHLEETVSALAPSRAVAVGATALDRFAAASEQRRTALWHCIQEGLARAQEQIGILGVRTSAERVAWFLGTLAHRQSADGRRAWLPMNYDDLADHLGLTRETVARRVAELRRAGTVEWRDGKRTVLAILDPEQLAEIAG